jgi:hypothetical protein
MLDRYDETEVAPQIEPNFDDNQRQISKGAARPNVNPRDPLLVTPAYGEGVYSKLVCCRLCHFLLPFMEDSRT